MDILVDGLTHAYGGQVAVDDLTLHIADGEFLVLLGPSGCGKTTTMRCVVGLESPRQGRITIGDQVVFDSAAGVNVPANRRNVGMVFQSYAVWPHRTVYQNVEFPLRMQRRPKAEIRDRVEEMLHLVGLSDFADRSGSALSGGQMQRVALARSLVMRPRVLLLDEPLSNLDAKLRERLRVELKQIQQRLGVTTIYVTHDQHEALALADRIAVMRDGVIERLDDAVSLYRQPRSHFVADFLGSSNLFRGRVVGQTAGGVRVALADVPIELDVAETSTETDVEVSIRPEDVRVGAPAAHGANGLDAVVDVVNFVGSQVNYLFRLPAAEGVTLSVVQPAGDELLRAGDAASLVLPRERLQLLTP